MTGIVTEHLTDKLAEDTRTRGMLVWLDREREIYPEPPPAVTYQHFHPDTKKPVHVVGFIGSDGDRTRDLRLDRPAR